jgi:hypothetical protein
MRSTYGVVALLAVFLRGPALPAQQDAEAEVVRAAVAAVFAELPRLPMIVDGTTYRGSNRVAALIAQELGARARRLDDVIRCTDKPHRTQSCDMAENVVAVTIGPAHVAGDSATVTVGWWYQDAPGVVAQCARTFRARRTSGGKWLMTEISRLRG